MDHKQHRSLPGAASSASMAFRRTQHRADAGGAHFAEGHFLRVGRHGLDMRRALVTEAKGLGWGKLPLSQRQNAAIMNLNVRTATNTGQSPLIWPTEADGDAHSGTEDPKITRQQVWLRSIIRAGPPRGQKPSDL